MGAFGSVRSSSVRALVVILSVAGLGGTWVVMGAASAHAATLATFNVHGFYTWTVPAGVKKVTFTVYGASGGDVVSGSPPTIVAVGGAGGEAVGTFRVRPGEKFMVAVGGRGATTGRRRVGSRGAKRQVGRKRSLTCSYVQWR